MSEEGEYDGGGEGGGDDSWESNGHELSKRSALRATIDQIALDDEDDRLAHGVGATPAPPPLGDASAVRPDEQVVDNTAYYNLVALLGSVYIRTKEGFALPLVFDARTQHMVENKRLKK